MYLKYIAEKGYERATQRENVVPLTRATAGKLRVEESLVRSSQEPTEAQSGILLRMATQVQNTHEEQLVRPTGNGEVAARQGE